MLVKKVNPEWTPSENKGLQVGETIDITDAKQLILNGDVVGVDEFGNEVGSYELYGVMSPRDIEDFKSFKDMQRQKATAARLQKENEELQKQAASLKVEADKPETKPEVKTEAKPKAKK